MSLLKATKDAVSPGGRHGVSRSEVRDPIGYAVLALNRLAQSDLIDRIGIRKQSERAVFELTRGGFRAVGAVSRGFKKAGQSGKPGTRVAPTQRKGVFDLTPTEDEQMLVDVVKEYADEVVAPAAAEANETCLTPQEVLGASLEIGIPTLGIPEELGGIFDERSSMAGVLVHEALSHGDLGIAVAALAPGAVATTISLFGSDQQQATYLPAFTGDNLPAAALALAEPTMLFDVLRPGTTATETPEGYLLTGVKSAVVRGAEAELLIVGADLNGTPALFLLEAGADGMTVEADPSMGVRAAGLCRVHLEQVAVPKSALLGDPEGTAYTETVRLSRLAWSALAVGTGQRVLDYVSGYVNERTAFGEPISHRQSVAFMVADIAIELQAMRLLTWKAASRVARGEDSARAIALAHQLCSTKGMQIGNNGVQLLGGHGFVKEHPVERWYRDLRAIGVMEGGVLV